ncbi:MAG: glycosyltransferase, partial [Bacteroidetes bacterium]
MDNRIKVLQNEQKGIAPALRLAFEHSRGSLITRMDADDLMLPAKLETLAGLLEATGPGHVATGGVSYFAEGKKLGAGYRQYAEWLNGLAAIGLHFREIYRECVIPSPCWMAQREDLVRIGAFTEDTYPEDYDLCFRMYHGGLKVVSVPEPLHQWRDHPRRTSRNSEVYRDNRF